MEEDHGISASADLTAVPLDFMCSDMDEDNGETTPTPPGYLRLSMKEMFRFTAVSMAMRRTGSQCKMAESPLAPSLLRRSSEYGGCRGKSDTARLRTRKREYSCGWWG